MEAEMIKKVLLPKLGQTMEEATIETWHKAEGDSIKKGDVLLEITTDKATLEVESYVSGILRNILRGKGTVLPVNTVIALMSDEAGEEISDEVLAEAMKLPDSAAPAEAGAQKPEAPKETDVPGPAQGSAIPVPQPTVSPTPAPVGKIIASPRAKKAAVEFDVPLAVLNGTGPQGRIVEADVNTYLEDVAPKKPTAAARKLALKNCVDLRRIDASPIKIEDVENAVPGALVAGEMPVAPMRKIIAERMTYSKQNIPHFSVVIDVDMSLVVALRKKLNNNGSSKVSYNDILMCACAVAARDVPGMANIWGGDKVIQLGSLDYGLAVSIPEGLIVPVVRGVDRKGIRAIAADSRDLVERARSKKLLPEEYEGGCMTISNLGMYHISTFTAIINPGQNSIMGVGAIINRVVPVGDAIGIRPMCKITAAFDHRVIDGAMAAQFMGVLKDTLEDAATLPI